MEKTGLDEESRSSGPDGPELGTYGPQVSLVMGNNDCSIYGADAWILGILDKELRYPTSVARQLENQYEGAPRPAGVWDGWIRMLKRPQSMPPHFPSGLVPRVRALLGKWRVPHKVEDVRERPQEGFPEHPKGHTLRSYQEAAVEAAVAVGRGVLDLPPRCHAHGDRILNHEGEVVRVEDVWMGDYLMAPDGSPCEVQESHYGSAELFRVAPRWGEPCTVTGSHILVIEEHIRTGGVTNRAWKRVEREVSVSSWLGWSNYRKRKSYLKSVAVDFPSTATLPIPPYLLGVLLGDGSIQNTPAITTGVPEIFKAVQELATHCGVKVPSVSGGEGRVPTYYLSRQNPKSKNQLTAWLRDLGLHGSHSRDKFLPLRYQRASRSDRLQLLAGLLDTDGHLANGYYYEFSTASFRMARDVAFVTRSVGLQAVYRPKIVKGVTYWRMSIMGDVGILPLRVPHKKTTHQSRWRKPKRSSFVVESVGVQPFVGFTVRGSRYLHHDFTILHNSGKTLCGIHIVAKLGLKTIWTAPTDAIVKQTVRAFGEHLGPNFAMQQTGAQNLEKAMDARVVVCTSATAVRLPPELYQTREVLFTDEVHHSASKTSHEIAKLCEHIYFRIGMSGTFFRSGDDTMALHALLSNVIYKVSPVGLRDAGYLVPTRVVYIPVDAPQLRCPGDDNSIVPQLKYGIYQHDYRNQLVAYAAGYLNRIGRKVLVLVSTKKQGNHLQRRIADLVRPRVDGAQYQPVEFVSTDRDRRTQQQILKAYNESSEVEVLIGTSLVGEGVDLPPADAVILATGGKAEVTLAQNAFRVITAAGGKRDAIIVDFADRHNKMLMRHSGQRMAFFYKEPLFEPVEVLPSIMHFGEWAKALKKV